MMNQEAFKSKLKHVTQFWSSLIWSFDSFGIDNLRHSPGNLNFLANNFIKQEITEFIHICLLNDDYDEKSQSTSDAHLNLFMEFHRFNSTFRGFLI